LLYLFENFALDTRRLELRMDGAVVTVEPQVFSLLLYLVENRERVVSKDDLIASVWEGRAVSDSTLDSRINAARKALGDSGKQQRLIRTMARRGVRFVGDVIQQSTDASAPALRQSSSALQQQIHFCTASDGVRIAYASAGSGPPLVKTANWLNHIEYDWQSPVWSHLLHGLAAEYQLVRYDERGNGLSDWDVEDISFEAFVRDLETVVDAAQLQRFALLGMSQGCAVSIVYALRHPERVSHLVLFGGYARGRRKRGSAIEIEKTEATTKLMRLGWGQENPAFRHMFTSHFIPGGTPDQMKWFNDLQRVTTSPNNAARIREAMNDIDVSQLLERVTVPTLVVHCQGDQVVPFEEGRLIASRISGARFVALESCNHLILPGEPALGRFLGEVRTFITKPA
jgi:pimeloyl-ACP methyl ester carboxylesterase/DNA-binding winged helix-turn-helix (wHTH) protein